MATVNEQLVRDGYAAFIEDGKVVRIDESAADAFWA